MKFQGFFTTSVLALALAACGPTGTQVKNDPGLKQESNNKAAQARMKDAAHMLDEAKPIEARDKYIEALNEDPLEFRAHEGLGEAYAWQGNLMASFAELAAHAETCKVSRFDTRMSDYVHAKFAKNATADLDVAPAKKGAAMLGLSEALRSAGDNKKDVALSQIDAALAIWPGSGILHYVRGRFLAEAGKKDEAINALVASLEHSGYFARRILGMGLDKELPGLLEKMRDKLIAEVKRYPADFESTTMLAALQLRLGQAKEAEATAQAALSRGEPRCDILVLRAMAAAATGDQALTDKAMSNLQMHVDDLSQAFSFEMASLFHGVLIDAHQEFNLGKLAEILEEPARAYFRFRLLAEQGTDKADPAFEAFQQALATTYPAGEHKPPTLPDPDQTDKLKYYEDMVQKRFAALVPNFKKCVQAKVPAKGANDPLVIRIELYPTGNVAQAAVEHRGPMSITQSYCILNQMMETAWPKPLRKNEGFKLQVHVGKDSTDPTQTSAGKVIHY